MASSRAKPFFRRSEGSRVGSLAVRARSLGPLVKTRPFGMTPRKRLRFKMTHYLLAQPLCPTHRASYNQTMPVFDDKQDELEHYETMMGVPRGRLAVTMDMITDAMALVGQHGVYCQSQRWPGKPVMDIQMVMKNLTDAKELIQSVMEKLKATA